MSNLKQSLQIAMGQQLSMTPQLQQAIRLLQLSTLELQQEIQDVLDKNPLLEINEDDTEITDLETTFNQDYQSPTAKIDANDTEIETTTQLQTELEYDWNDVIPQDLSTDSHWDDTFQHSSTSSTDTDWMDNNDSHEESLQDHLNWQLNLSSMTLYDLSIAEAIIDSIDHDGYLQLDLNELLLDLQQQRPHDYASLELDEIQTVLKRIQQFDPPGVAARTLSECLLIQLRQLPDSFPGISTAIKICQEHIELLAQGDQKALLKQLDLQEQALIEAIAVIRSLNPKPGSLIGQTASEYVIPDVIVRKFRDDWIVDLNPDVAPKLQVNALYSDMIKRADSSSDNVYLKNHLQEARWFIKSLHSRNETLLKVANEVIARQIDFLEQGEAAMKPMILHDIAAAVGMHESTISRVTTQKYIHTPRGVFELKYFFSSQVSTDNGEGASSVAIRALLKRLIAQEDPKKPLSDSKLTILLQKEGINVARRTIAKYRESLGISASNERKRLL